MAFPHLHDTNSCCEVCILYLSHPTMFRVARLQLLALLVGSASASLRGGEESGEAALSAEHHLEFLQWATAHDKKYDSDDHMLERLGVWFENHGTCVCVVVISFRYHSKG